MYIFKSISPIWYPKIPVWGSGFVQIFEIFYQLDPEHDQTLNFGLSISVFLYFSAFIMNKMDTPRNKLLHIKFNLRVIVHKNIKNQQKITPNKIYIKWWLYPNSLSQKLELDLIPRKNQADPAEVFHGCLQ